jgi:hypothetical protein
MAVSCAIFCTNYNTEVKIARHNFVVKDHNCTCWLKYEKFEVDASISILDSFHFALAISYAKISKGSNEGP